MTFTQYLIAFFVIWIAGYSIVNRICACFESCSISKAYGESVKNGVKVTDSDVENATKWIKNEIEK